MFERLIQLIGEEKLEKLKKSTVLIFGLGGVGGSATEAIARSAFGTIILVDKDTVELSNINRQLVALHSTINHTKTEVLKKRILDINPACNVITYNMFYNFETKDQIWQNKIDYVIDCIDTITFKIDIAKVCQDKGIPHISVMGTGNKYHPEKLEIMPLSKTEYDPIAKVMRKKLRIDYKLNEIIVVASKEIPEKTDSTTQSPSSNAFVPNTAGIIAASYIFNKAIE
ncbi:tRNA threonylcarbamoyladenosine dehydratase [Candidatus Izimaplasma bacterium HR1]|jgi:tRNA A37 threonylcarbamoyladenosine dehydratase|uniref:tRNA threonylcarbamoyladenosine dehydratase n=1 Tax=Candidatus Izimoplasma sp. HR1 TaxID=1541959 RepID=UPI0004F91A4F|nr:tRNA threonylcarbamoyladenosine dehydratase [Candidatus Izimaplasma bacterium HR1]